MEYTSEKEAIVTGKPSDNCFKLIEKVHGADTKEMLFIGDNLYTDILFANRAGVDSLLVLTGVTAPEEFEELIKRDDTGNPSYIAENLKFWE